MEIALAVFSIAKESSISPRTATRRIEKLTQNHILDFRIIRDMSSMNLTGYIDFVLMVAVNKSAYGGVIERMYREMQESLTDIPLDIAGSDVIIALFFCSNIPAVDSIVTRVKSYSGVQRVELFITTKVVYNREWLVREINKKLRSYTKTTVRSGAIK
jgi:DNA-binding Lrp family transcriptional regulator